MVLPILMFVGAIGLAIVLWKHAGGGGGIAGIAEGVRSTVTSPYSASIQKLLVRPYQVVRAGEPIAVILPSDLRVDIGLLQAELDLARMQLQPSIAEANAMNYEQIQVDLLRTKAELAIAKVNAERAENQVRRNEPLYKEKLVSEDVYDLSVKTLQMYRAEIMEKSNAVHHIEARLADLKTLGTPTAGDTNSLLATTLTRLRRLQGAVATNWAPITIQAPIDGMVASIFRHEGESVIPGEPLLYIYSLSSERVVGYLRQPYSVQPQIGMTVELVTREREPKRFSGVVSEIGAQVETITNALAYLRPGSLVDAGLPVVVAIPEGSPVRPGEMVDLVFRARTRNGDVRVAQQPSTASSSTK